MNTPVDITAYSRIVEAVRAHLSFDNRTFDERTAFLAPLNTDYVEGLDEVVVMVCPAGASADGGGQGGQDGGGYVRQKARVTFASFVRINVDSHGRIEEAFLEASGGVLRLQHALWELFRHTYLGTGVLIEPMMFQNNGTPRWVARGVVRADQTWSLVYEKNLPDAALSLGEADFGNP